jgi:hypothetical protein
MRNLEPAPVETEAPAGRWGLPQQFLFVAALLTILSLCLGVYALWLYPTPIAFDSSQDTRAVLDRLGLRQTMVIWMNLSQGPNAPRSPEELAYDKAYATFRFWLILAIVSTVSTAGLYIAAWATSRFPTRARQTDTAPGSPLATRS